MNTRMKILFISMFLFSMLHATTIQTSKDIYAPQEDITISFQGMLGNSKDWIGIYPSGSTNDWANVLRWNWTDGTTDGNLTLDRLPDGTYEARAFFQDTFELEASYGFVVDGVALEANVSTSKILYHSDENVTVHFSNMLGNTKDWVGIYPEGNSSEWTNVVAWYYTNGLLDGNLTFSGLADGNYSARVFFNDSLTLEANTSFVIQPIESNITEVNLTLNKSTYAQNELIFIQYDKMQGNQTDWIGIYPAGAGFEFENVIDWKSTKGNISGELSLGGFPQDTQLIGFTPMPGLPAGDYEVRAFFNNTLNVEKTIPFTVQETPVTSVMYEEANGSISNDWIHVSGPYPPVYYNGVVRLKAKWVNSQTNTSEYTLPFSLPNTTDKVLELDVGGQGRWTPHFNVGVLVQTTLGYRRMLWDSFMNHYSVPANQDGVVLKYPTYVELQRNTANSRKHFRVNIEKYLRILEPNNKLLSVTAFFATGGDLDNIKLSSH